MPVPLIAMDREILFPNGPMLGVMLGRRLIGAIHSGGGAALGQP